MIYDCFPFHNELDVLEVRLHELDGVVDRFVLAEAPLTHSGRPKPLHFSENRGRFPRFLDRIVHVVVDDFPAADMSVPGESWKYERHQRDALSRGLAGLSDEDVVITSDVDEVPRAGAVRAYRPEMGLVALAQSMHTYWLNMACRGQEYAWCKILPWRMARAMTHCQIRYTPGTVMKDGGWHLSFMGGVDDVVGKIEAWAHQEYNIPRCKDPAKIARDMEAGIDPHGREVRYRLEALDASYPRHVLENRVRYARLIKEQPGQDGPGDLRTVEWNLRVWDREYAWPKDGDEWDEAARSAGVPYEGWKESLARALLYPHLGESRTALEVGPGHGRWSALIAPRVGRLLLADISGSCIEHTRRRLGSGARAEFHVTGGRDLAFCPPSSVDFVWSFDTFVHIEEPEARAYAAEFSRVLKRHGMGVVHHPGSPTPGQRRAGCRSRVTSALFARALAERGLFVVRQTDSWEGGDVRAAGDAITVFAKP